MLEWLISASWKVASPLQIPQWDLLQIGYAQLQLGSISWGNEGVQSVLVSVYRVCRFLSVGNVQADFGFCLPFVWCAELPAAGREMWSHSSPVGPLGAVETGHGVMVLNSTSISLG